MDNREENSRNTEQDRVDNPVENTVSTMVETALSENKGNGKKEKSREKKECAGTGKQSVGQHIGKGRGICSDDRSRNCGGCWDSMVPACLQIVERIPPVK